MKGDKAVDCKKILSNLFLFGNIGDKHIGIFDIVRV